MDRRSFLSNMSAASVASVAGATTLTAKADALEDAMSIELDKRIATPWMCSIDPTPEAVAGDTRPWYQHDDPRLPVMPAAPTLIDFLQAALRAPRLTFCKARGWRGSMVLTRNSCWPACCTISVLKKLIRTDHGYWCAQMVAPYVDEEVAWAIEKHQALRFFSR